jgi:type VI protein secretion system component VasK
MSIIDFLTYVVSSPLTSFIFVMILAASAILVAVVAIAVAIVVSHVHIGVAVPSTKDGLTVGLTSAGTVIVATIALVRRRARRATARGEDDNTQK